MNHDSGGLATGVTNRGIAVMVSLVGVRRCVKSENRMGGLLFTYKHVVSGAAVVVGAGGGVVGSFTPGGQCQWSLWGIQVGVASA